LSRTTALGAGVDDRLCGLDLQPEQGADVPQVGGFLVRQDAVAPCHGRESLDVAPVSVENLFCGHAQRERHVVQPVDLLTGHDVVFQHAIEQFGVGDGLGAAAEAGRRHAPHELGDVGNWPPRIGP